jgi:hypothetical protein
VIPQLTKLHPTLTLQTTLRKNKRREKDW